jgi:hypothetical protein
VWAGPRCNDNQANAQNTLRDTLPKSSLHGEVV